MGTATSITLRLFPLARPSSRAVACKVVNRAWRISWRITWSASLCRRTRSAWESRALLTLAWPALLWPRFHCLICWPLRPSGPRGTRCQRAWRCTVPCQTPLPLNSPGARLHSRRSSRPTVPAVQPSRGIGSSPFDRTARLQGQAVLVAQADWLWPKRGPVRHWSLPERERYLQFNEVGALSSLSLLEPLSPVLGRLGLPGDRPLIAVWHRVMFRARAFPSGGGQIPFPGESREQPWADFAFPGGDRLTRDSSPQGGIPDDLCQGKFPCAVFREAVCRRGISPRALLQGG